MIERTAVTAIRRFDSEQNEEEKLVLNRQLKG